MSGKRIHLPNGTQVQATGLTSDSRAVSKGSIFFAISGTQADGHQFVQQAFEAGAVAVIGEKTIANAPSAYLQVKDSRLALAEAAAEFHGHPSQRMWVLGVTGTSGKTTSTYLLESILGAAGRKVGVIGTVNFRFGGKVYPSTHTTPGPIELQALLAEMKRDGCDTVVMEVSSHALKQHRVAGVAFDGALFTNLSPEHLDFHPDMGDYFRSKALLFTRYLEAASSGGKKPFARVNLDSDYGDQLLQAGLKRPHPGTQITGFSLKEMTNLTFGLEGVRGEWNGVKIESALVGAFNASNVLGAVALAQDLGVSSDAISRGVRALSCVPGRMELVRPDFPVGVRVMVDYAHKPDALEKVLETLRALVPRGGKGRLITVFGCGGDRDRTKRPIMGGTATRISDHVVVTSDNPRTEDPSLIIAEILKGIQGGSWEVEPDRRKAIEKAVETAKIGDLIVIAGKGHEDYQILGKTKIHFDDREIALEALTRVFKSL